MVYSNEEQLLEPQMPQTTITIHATDTPHGTIRYARLVVRYGCMRICQSLMLHRLCPEYRSLIEPDSLGFCLL